MTQEYIFPQPTKLPDKSSYLVEHVTEEMLNRYHYSRILQEYKLFRTEIDQSTVTELQNLTDRLNQFLQNWNDRTDVEIHQSISIYVLYLGQLHDLIKNNKFRNLNQDIVGGLKKSFKNFNAFAQVYLRNFTSKARAEMRSRIGEYVNSLVFQRTPNVEEQESLSMNPGYWHETGSFILESFLKDGLISPAEALRRGTAIQTGELVSGNHAFRNDDYEAASVAGDDAGVGATTIDNRIYVLESVSAVAKLPHAYTKTAVTWFDQFPVHIFIDASLLKKSEVVVGYSPGSTNTRENCFLGNIPKMCVTYIFVPRNKLQEPVIKLLQSEGIQVLPSERYGKWLSVRINADGAVGDFLNGRSE